MHLWNVFFLLSSYFCYYFSQLQLAQTQEVTFLNHNTKKTVFFFWWSGKNVKNWWCMRNHKRQTSAGCARVISVSWIFCRERIIEWKMSDFFHQIKEAHLQAHKCCKYMYTHTSREHPSIYLIPSQSNRFSFYISFASDAGKHSPKPL